MGGIVVYMYIYIRLVSYGYPVRIPRDRQLWFSNEPIIYMLIQIIIGLVIVLFNLAVVTGLTTSDEVDSDAAPYIVAAVSVINILLTVAMIAA